MPIAGHTFGPDGRCSCSIRFADIAWQSPPMTPRERALREAAEAVLRARDADLAPGYSRRLSEALDALQAALKARCPMTSRQNVDRNGAETVSRNQTDKREAQHV